MRSKISIKRINSSVVKSIFKKEAKFSNKCKICGLEFTDPERTKKHMIKAHSKPKREKQDH
jgi:predicted restriction endonuclease